MHILQGKALDQKIDTFMSRKLDKFPELAKKDSHRSRFIPQLSALRFTAN